MPSPGVITSDGTDLYVVNNNTSILKVNASTGAGTQLASGFTNIRSMVYANSTLYVLDAGTSISSVDVANGNKQVVSVSNSGIDGSEYSSVFDGTHLYGLTWDGTALYTVNAVSRLSGGNKVTNVYQLTLSGASATMSVYYTLNANALYQPDIACKYILFNGSSTFYINDTINTELIWTVSKTSPITGGYDTTGGQNVNGLAFYNNVLYYSDTSNNQIDRFDGDYYTFVGSGVSGTSDNTTGSSATFTDPTFLVAIASGVYVSDSVNSTIRKIVYTGQNAVTTLTVTLGGGGGGDPYVTTFNNLTYKLPTIDAPIRYFQTVEDGKTLTVNAMLKTVDSSELDTNTIQSLIKLKHTMSGAQFTRLTEKAFQSETLSFFEKIRIQYGDEYLTLNLWDSKFEIVENKASFLPKTVSGDGLLAKSTGIYNKGYRSKTVQFQFGTTSIFLSVYNSPMVRNGIYITTGTSGNGVIANTLTEADMRLSSLDSTTPVPTVDAKKKKVIVETFADSEGLRTRNITTYH